MLHASFGVHTPTNKFINAYITAAGSMIQKCIQLEHVYLPQYNNII